MTAFAAANDAIFADPNHASDALWFPKGQGAGLPVRVIRGAPDVETGFAQSRVITDGVTISVRVSEVVKAARGDRIEIDGETFAVTAEPRRDQLRLNWTVEAKAV